MPNRSEWLRCQMVPNCAEWYQMVLTGAEWCLMVPNGIVLCWVVINGAIWSHMVPNGITWCWVVSNSTELCNRVPNGVEWYQMVPNDAEWCRMMPNGVDTSEFRMVNCYFLSILSCNKLKPFAPIVRFVIFFSRNEVSIPLFIWRRRHHILFLFVIRHPDMWNMDSFSLFPKT